MKEESVHGEGADKISSLPPLEQTCEHCGGSGKRKRTLKSKTRTLEIEDKCLYCNGRGKQLSKAGEEIIRIINEYALNSSLQSIEDDLRYVERRIDCIRPDTSY